MQLGVFLFCRFKMQTAGYIGMAAFSYGAPPLYNQFFSFGLNRILLQQFCFVNENRQVFLLKKIRFLENLQNICYYRVIKLKRGMFMKISTKGRYALRMLLDLAEHQNSGYVSLKNIAQRQNISKKYLEQIIPIFNRSDILKTNRGYQGGYQLAKAPSQYTVGEILRLTEGSLSPVACLDQDPNGCQRSAECSMLPVWQGLGRVINAYLDGITLQDILDQQQERYTNDYVI